MPRTRSNSRASGSPPLVFAHRQAAAVAAVLWLHGFGDGPEGWANEFSTLRANNPAVHWVFMRGSPKPQTCFDGARVPGWGNYLDANCTRVGTADHTNQGIVAEEVLTEGHNLLDEIVRTTGVPPHRIVVGGFSMGATAAAEIALRYASGPVGALVMLNGWLLPGARAVIAQAAASTLPPTLVSHGTADEQVGFDLGVEAAQVLRAAGVAVRFEEHDDQQHVPSGFGPGKELAAQLVSDFAASAARAERRDARIEVMSTSG